MKIQQPLLKSTLLLNVLLLIGIALHAQFPFELQRDLTLPVIEDGEQLGSAWAGGLSSPQFSRIDVDFDGDLDLFLFDRDGNRTLVFLNQNPEVGEIEYVYSAEYSADFPDLRDWVLLRDYNCDGKPDIFTSFQSSIRVYMNTSTPEDGLSWELAANQLMAEYDFGGGPDMLPAICLSIDLPSIIDYDGDGDLDIVTFTETAMTMYFFECQSADNGDCESLEYVCTNRCYGMAAEGSESNNWTISPDFTCSFNVADPRENAGSDGERENERFLRHTGSTLCSIDFDQNGLLDLVIGDVDYDVLAGLYMEDAVDGQDSTVFVDTTFPGSLDDVPVQLHRFPAAYYEDINNDGVNDMIVASNAKFNMDDDRGVWLYINNGENDLPDFELVTKDFLQNDMIDFGRGAYPVMFDHNGDGLRDLVVANKEYNLDAEEYYPSQLALFENTGTADFPEFTLIDTNYVSIPNALFESVKATFGDLDGDGDSDLIIGEEHGFMHWYENIAEAGEPASFTELPVDTLRTADGTAIDLGQFATPQLTDVDGDGRIDLIAGEKLGIVNYFRNTGTQQSFSFIQQQGQAGDSLGGVWADSQFGIYGHSVPHLYEAPNATTYLLMANEIGTIQLFDNVDDNITGYFNEIEASFLDLQESSRAGVWMEDINNDDIPDLFYGINNGGLLFFRGVNPDGINEEGNDQSMLVYPNPAMDMVSVGFREAIEGELRLMDVRGRTLETRAINGRSNLRLSIDRYPSGLYFIEVRNASERFTSPLIIR